MTELHQHQMLGTALGRWCLMAHLNKYHWAYIPDVIPRAGKRARDKWTPKLDRKVAELRKAGKEYKTIAEEMGLTASAVKARLGRLGVSKGIPKVEQSTHRPCKVCGRPVKRVHRSTKCYNCKRAAMMERNQ